jgi:hypothetical protein
MDELLLREEKIMTMQFINDDFLPLMFIKGTNDFKEIKSETHWIEEVGFTIALLGNGPGDRFLVALYGIEAVEPENEGIYYFDDKTEAEQFYEKLLSDHYQADNDYESEDGR